MRGLDHSNGQVLMYIRRSLPPLLAALSLLSAACGTSDSAKSSPRDAVGQSSAEGAAEGTSMGTEGTGSGTSNQPGTPANDTTPHRPAP
ncbi:MAG TPA: hypothetical protein VGV85_15710 [Longimicrobiaceae bacterium]|nr:hypothetical protein [Longimicrobiaceae bacterium]